MVESRLPKLRPALRKVVPRRRTPIRCAALEHPAVAERSLGKAGYGDVGQVVRKAEGTHFELDGDHGRIVVSARDTSGQYSLMEFTVSPEAAGLANEGSGYGAHLHRECEEVFLITSGSLEFLLGAEVTTLREGDCVRVPSGRPHGYRNISGEPVSMLVSFVPAGLEELFVKYRSDQEDTPEEGFIAEATRRFASEFDLPDLAE